MPSFKCCTVVIKVSSNCHLRAGDDPSSMAVQAAFSQRGDEWICGASGLPAFEIDIMVQQRQTRMLNEDRLRRPTLSLRCAPLSYLGDIDPTLGGYPGRASIRRQLH
jgi:hypothetical protein